MSEQSHDALSGADAATEAPEESVDHERDAVGDAADTGGLVPPDDAE